MAKLEKCPDCKVYFEEEWTPSTGTFYYCPKCGTHKSVFLARKTDKVKRINLPLTATTPKPGMIAKMSDEICNQILSDPPLRFAFRLAEKMFAEHNLPGKAIFRNGRISRADGINVYLTYKSVRRAHKDGFCEYATYGYLWSDYYKAEGGYERMTIGGNCGIWALLIHEFAHVLQIIAGERWYRSAHNSYWASHVQELQILYPFKEVKSL